MSPWFSRIGDQRLFGIWQHGDDCLPPLSPDGFTPFIYRQEGSALQERYTIHPRLQPSGNPFKYRVEALSLQPRTRCIITTMLDDVLHCFCLFLLFVWCPCKAINLSVQYNGGILPDIILLTHCYYHWETRLNVGLTERIELSTYSLRYLAAVVRQRTNINS